MLGLRYYDCKLDEEAARLSEILNLVPGNTVAEVGAGRGSMTVRIARRVQPGGRVLSTDVEPEKLVKVHHAVHQAGAKNVIVMGGTQIGAEFRANSCDAIYMRVAYHHFTDPQQMNRSLFRALKPGGRLAVIEFSPSLLFPAPRPKGVPRRRGGHGIPKELLVNELTAAGFEKVRDYEWPFRLYCVLFRRPAA
jgi:ubiquinone/menaquinone biosynthesis C-methylase UbiE